MPCLSVTFLHQEVLKIDPACPVCGNGDEDVVHMLFQCDFARGCWFNSPLPLRSGEFSNLLIQTIPILNQDLSNDQWTSFVNIAWAIWHCRNEKAYAGKHPSLDRFSYFLHTANSETMIANTSTCTLQRQQVQLTIVNPVSTYLVCMIDGSLSQSW